MPLFIVAHNTLYTTTLFLYIPYISRIHSVFNPYISRLYIGTGYIQDKTEINNRKL